MNTKRINLENVKDKQMKLQCKLHCLSKDLEGLTARYFSFQRKIQDLQAAGTALGSIPSGTEKYNLKTSKVLYGKLKKLNISLNEKDGVNQKAEEQYQELQGKYEQFSTQLNSYNEEGEQLSDLIEDLENKKGEAILRHLRVLQEQFREIFQKIVPIGDAELVLYGDKGVNVEIDHDTPITVKQAIHDLFIYHAICITMY